MQGHFLKCVRPAHSPFPHLISHIPKQKPLLWEKWPTTYVSVCSPNLHASRVWSPRRLYTRYRPRLGQTERETFVWLDQNNQSKTICSRLMKAHAQVHRNRHNERLVWLLGQVGSRCRNKLPVSHGFDSSAGNPSSCRSGGRKWEKRASLQ